MVFANVDTKRNTTLRYALKMKYNVETVTNVPVYGTQNTNQNYLQMTEKTISFYSKFLDAIRNGTKTQTRRAHPYNFAANDIVTIEEDDTLQIKILSVRGERLRDINDEDGIKEGYASSDEFLKGDWAVEQLKTGNPWVWVYEFRRVQNET